MKKNPFYPGRQGDQAVWHGNFSGKLSALATTLGLTPAQLAAILADCAWMIYILQLWLPAVRAWAKACTDALIEAQTGASNGAQVLPAFVAPPLPTGTIPVNAGALLRIFVAIQMIKDSGLLVGQEYNGASAVLSAAALTYVAAMLQAVAQLLYFVFLVFGARRD